MSNIPKSKRSKSKLETQHLAYQIRRVVVYSLSADFGYSKERMQADIQKRYSSSTEEQLEKKMEAAEDFYADFIKLEREEVSKLCQGICRHLRMANTIYPRRIVEWDERRLQMDKALECCNALQDELQYIADTIPSDKNKYCSVVLQIQELFNKIKSLRSSDNRFLKKIEGIENEG